MTSVLYIKVVFTVVKMDSTSLCTKGVKSLFTTQRNGFSFDYNSRMKLNNQARCGTNNFIFQVNHTQYYVPPTHVGNVGISSPSSLNLKI